MLLHVGSRARIQELNMIPQTWITRMLVPMVTLYESGCKRPEMLLYYAG